MSRWSLVGPHALAGVALWNAATGDLLKTLVAMLWCAALAWAHARQQKEPTQ